MTSHRPRRRRRLLLILTPPALLTTAWSLGLLWFLHVTTNIPPPPPPHSDAILALTGGAGRVDTALRLLASGAAGRLLISGVGRTAEFLELAHRAGVPTILAPQVTLGRNALSTRGNAAEAAAWVRSNNVGSLIVVTSYYHMPRALAELRQTLPGVVLHRVPVVSGPKSSSNRIELRLLAAEYTKFLAVELGLSRFGNLNDPADGNGQFTSSGTSVGDLGKTE